MSTAQDPSRRFTHRIGLQITNLTPDPGWKSAMPDLPPVIAAIHLDAHVLLTAAVDRHAAATRPQLTGIEVNSLTVTWGDLAIEASGSVAAASEGVAQGVINLRVRNWRQLPGVLVALGVIKPEIGPTALRMFEVLAAAGPDPAVLEAPLTFKSGRLSFGPFPVGQAPVIAYRQ